MARPLANSPLVLLALCLWILACRASLAKGDDPNTLNQQVHQLITQQRYQEALPIAQRAVEVARRARGPEQPETVIALYNLGVIFDELGDYARAEPLLEQAAQMSQKVFGAEDPVTAITLTGLASACEGMHEYGKAEPLYQRALRIDHKALGREHPDPYYLFPILKGTETDLATAILRYKGVVLDSIVEDRLLAEARRGSEDQKLVEQLNLDKSQLGQLYLQPERSAESNQRIEALEGEIEKIESQFAQLVAGLGQARHALGVRLDQVQAIIPNDGALIEYLRYWQYLGKRIYEQRYGAMVLISKGAPVWIPLGKVEDVERLVRRYASMVRGPSEEEELSANLQALYEALWAPLGLSLPSQTKRIIISPDGQLNFISFATLLNRDKQFLAETYNVQYVASGRDLLREAKPSSVKKVVLFANPDFDLRSAPMLAKGDNGFSDPGRKSIGRDERGDIEDWSFGSLEGTQKEGDELIKKFVGWSWTPTDYTKKEATKEALLKIRSPYILHLATHGFFAKENPTTNQTDSGSSLKVRQSVTKSRFFKNPMHRSGLALAGAQTTIEAWKLDEVPPVGNDGILTAEDVSTLDLQGTWLVTLSACDTGSGEARAGEGVMGLRRGFIQAGAQNLLMTLWPISDEVTVLIMSDFYEAAHASGSAPEALAKVQRDWLVKLRKEQGLASAVNLAGPFIMSFQGSLGLMAEPSVSASSPLTGVAPSPTPSELLAAAQRDLDAKDFAKALDLFQQAADAGSATAMNNLGVLYRDGQGVAQDYGKAREWFQRAANAGAAAAMNHLGWLYDGGKDVAQDYDMARQWYQKAANAGNTDAMYNLGLLYRDGQGVAQDYDKACEWFQKAADAGDADAKEALLRLHYQ